MIIKTMISFQFLLVRLKVADLTIETLMPVLFQFLLVRLKEGLILNPYNRVWYFNSYWCD